MVEVLDLKKPNFGKRRLMIQFIFGEWGLMVQLILVIGRF